jgi:hypothetical protein
MFYQLKPFIGSPTQIQQKLENLIPAVFKSLWKIKIKCISGGICINNPVKFQKLMAFKKEISYGIRVYILNLTTIWKLKSVKG